MPTIRVLHITPSVRLLGARRSLLTLIRELAGTRYDPVALAPEAGALTNELDKRHLPWIKLRLPPWRKGASWLTLPARTAALREIIARERIGLIHCNEIYSNPHAAVAASGGALALALAGALLSRRLAHPLTVPVVTHMRLSVTPRMARNYLLGEASRIIAVSEAAAADFDIFHWKARKVRVVHNGVDFEEFDNARARRRLTRRELGFDDDDFVIGQIGLLMPRKRPRFLLDAAAPILNRVPNAKFLFIGETSPGQESYADELKALAERAGISSAVRFLPFQRRIADFFAALDLNVLVSNDEGFGRVIIEAAAAGVPTIGSNTGGIPELIEDGKTGFLVGLRNVDDKTFWKELPAFVDLVAALAADTQTCRAMGAAACERAHALFSAGKHARAVTAVFDEALENAART
ncbi:MAG: glycosyltransferase family 4 protein [bacterium]|nr:glycosyltransferase family 4 protein [Candidatus Sumerlaeota bacterium]